MSIKPSRPRNCGFSAPCGPSTRRKWCAGSFAAIAPRKGVAKDSQVETFAALRLHIDTWRWAGVPFYIRAGKCLPVTATEVMVTLKAPPLAVFDASDSMPCNYFRLRLSPEVVIGTGALVKRNGEEMRGEPVELIARHQSQSEKSPYERLLGDAVRGDTSLFTQDACVEAAWRVVDPVLSDPPAGDIVRTRKLGPGRLRESDGRRGGLA